MGRMAWWNGGGEHRRRGTDNFIPPEVWIQIDRRDTAIVKVLTAQENLDHRAAPMGPIAAVRCDVAVIVSTDRVAVKMQRPVRPLLDGHRLDPLPVLAGGQHDRRPSRFGGGSRIHRPEQPEQQNHQSKPVASAGGKVHHKSGINHVRRVEKLGVRGHGNALPCVELTSNSSLPEPGSKFLHVAI